MFILVDSSRRLKRMEKRIMAKIDDYVAQQKASLEALGTAISGLTGDIDVLDGKIAELQAALTEGTLTEAQEAAVKAVTDQLAVVAGNAASLDARTPPATPVEPPPAEPTG